jgi:hypothetical protein
MTVTTPTKKLHGLPAWFARFWNTAIRFGRGDMCWGNKSWHILFSELSASSCLALRLLRFLTMRHRPKSGEPARKHGHIAARSRSAKGGTRLLIWVAPTCGISRLLSRFARRAGLVHLRQTFVLRCHGNDGWPLRAEASSNLLFGGAAWRHARDNPTQAPSAPQPR